jgi:putative DNA-invertase from lambdoid prophage Rac
MKIYSYCRVSTSGQAESGLSLEEQTRRIKGRALENGWELQHVGVSGSVALAAQLAQVLRPSDQVIAAKFDRVFRSALDALETIASFKQRKTSGYWTSAATAAAMAFPNWC